MSLTTIFWSTFYTWSSYLSKKPVPKLFQLSLSSLESYSQSYLFSLLGLEGQRVVALALSQGRPRPSFVDLHRDVGLDRRVREEVLHEGLHRVEGVAALLAVVPTLRLLGRLRSLVVVACRGLKVKFLTLNFSGCIEHIQSQACLLTPSVLAWQVITNLIRSEIALNGLGMASN